MRCRQCRPFRSNFAANIFMYSMRANYLRISSERALKSVAISFFAAPLVNQLV